MIEIDNGPWPWLSSGLAVLLAAVASAHAILNKRDVRAAIGWVGLAWLVPFLGAILYGLFGINRIRRRAGELRRRPTPSTLAEPPSSRTPRLADALPRESRYLAAIGELVDSLTPAPLTGGNTVTPLVTGDAAYDAMETAIVTAERSVGLATYIFDHDSVGLRFADALADAQNRGVDVRVLVDSVGSRYSTPPMPRVLQEAGLPTAEFLPTFPPLQMPYANLRNHRKLLVVDGRTAFLGGMNIRVGHLSQPPTSVDPIRDVHFRVEGPVVAQLTETFAEDWAFCRHETLTGEAWFPPSQVAGEAWARGLASGPGDDPETLRWTFLAALLRARRRIRIVTPYFLPDHVLVTALGLAARRGVSVEILLPEHGNLRLVQWASRNQLPRLLSEGCSLWLTPPPFDHAKLLTIDGVWTLIGSPNWDPRSLRLNFELAVECYDPALGAELDRIIDSRKAAARPIDGAEYTRRSLPVRLRDGAAWLLSPYL